MVGEMKEETIGSWTDRQADRKTDTQTYKHIFMHAGRQTDWLNDQPIDCLRDRLMDLTADWLTDRLTGQYVHLREDERMCTGDISQGVVH